MTVRGPLQAGNEGSSLGLWLLVLLFVAAASRSVVGSDVRRLTTPPDEFSAKRAAAHLEWLCAEPHPIGSSAGERVAERLRVELRRAGFETEPLIGNVFGHWPGLMDGAEASPGLLLVAHHDSTPFGPGAGDDGAAVAALLEVARVVGSRPRAKRSISVLFTDGEEEGKVGAGVFLSRKLPRFVSSETLVINVEAVGNRGPTVLFQTSQDNGDLVQAYAGSVARPHGSSLAEFLFSLVPNDTDFTEFRGAGFRGLNLAMVGGSSAYHAPFDTPENLHVPSLQRLGDTLLALVSELERADAAGALAPQDVVFHGLVEAWFVMLPRRVAAWALVALVLAPLALLWTREACRPRPSSLAAALVMPALAGLLGLSLQGTMSLTLEPLSHFALGYKPRGDFTSAVLAALGTLITGASLSRAGAARIGPDLIRRTSAAGLSLYCLGLLALAPVHLGAAWVLAMPLPAAAWALRLSAADSPGSPRSYHGHGWLVALCGLPVVWFAGSWLDLTLLTSLRPSAMAVIAWGTLAVGLPFIGAVLSQQTPPTGRPVSRLDISLSALGLSLLCLSSVVRAVGS